jgi:hypothetical protein
MNVAMLVAFLEVWAQFQTMAVILVLHKTSCMMLICVLH